MKILGLEIFYELPEDFEGNLPDALIELAEYLESKDKIDFARNPSTDSNKEELWNNFWSAREDGYCIYGGYSLNERKNGEWVKLDNEL